MTRERHKMGSDTSAFCAKLWSSDLSTTQRSLLLPEFHFIGVSCATLWNTTHLSVTSCPPLLGLDMCERQSNVPEEKLMGGLVKFFSIHMGPRKDLSPRARPLSERRAGWGLTGMKCPFLNNFKSASRRTVHHLGYIAPRTMMVQLPHLLSALLTHQ